MFNKRKKNKLLTSIVFWTVCIDLFVVILLIAFLLIKNKSIPTLNDLIDIKTYIALVLAILLNSIVSFLVQTHKAKFEDCEKLTENYDELNRMYSKSEKFCFYNKSISAYKCGRRATHCKRTNNIGSIDSYVFPIVDFIDLRGKKLVINDSQEQYHLPNEANANFNKLNTIHNSTLFFNSPTIRLCNIIESNNTVQCVTGRTDYFKSLSTNRSMDYKIDGVSLRDKLEFDNKITPLSASKLSNHIGYNGLIKTSDNKYIFIKRNKKGSIGKNMLQVSIGASLKCKRALDEKGVLTDDGIVMAIKAEIIDELSLKYLPQFEIRQEDLFKALSIKNIHYFYRDLVEGGKPQFMFEYDIPISSVDIGVAIKKGKKAAKKSKSRFNRFSKVDGTKCIFIDEKELYKIYIAPDIIAIPKKNHKFRVYRMMPSHSACLALLRKEKDRIVVDEALCKSKYDINTNKKASALCEDRIYFGKNIVAVIDGVTSKKKVKLGNSGGVNAAVKIENAFQKCEKSNHYWDIKIIETLNKAVKNIELTHKKGKASVIYYNRINNSIVSYGDCGYMTSCLPSTYYTKHYDTINSNNRSNFIKNYIEQHLRQGEEIAKAEQRIEQAFLTSTKDDKGREEILNNIISDENHSNQDECAGGYPVIGGGSFKESLIKRIDVAQNTYIILASDGYTELLPNLKDTEAKLLDIIKNDKLCYKINVGTKGVYDGQISFDDRSYLKFHLT